MILMLALCGVYGLTMIFYFHYKRNYKSKNKKLLQLRKFQSSTAFRENQLKLKLEEVIEERTNFRKRNKIEEMCEQAGMPMRYSEYRLITIAFAIVLPILIFMFLHNIYMAIIGIFLGYISFGQYVHFVRNARVKKLDKQIGSFLQIITERYKTQGDFATALRMCQSDYLPKEFMYKQIKQTLLDIDLGMTTSDALEGLARRTGNKFMYRLVDYYNIASELGTQESKEIIVAQAFQQYKADYDLKITLRKEINSVVTSAYVMVASIPCMVIYQCLTNDDYVDFMLNTTMGQIGSTGIVAVIIGAMWFINQQLGKPIE